MNFESQFNKSLLALKAHHYDLFVRIQKFLAQESLFQPNTENILSKKPREFWDPQAPSQTIDTSLKTICWLGTHLGKNIISKVESTRHHTHIIIEPDLKNFCFFMMLPQTESLLKEKNIVWIVGVSLQDFPIFLRKLSTTPLLPQLTAQVNFISTEPSHDYFSKMMETWNSFFSASALSSGICATDEYFGFHNSLTNIKQLLKAPLIQKFKNKFRGIPGIVISSGPSLNQTLPLLKGLEDKALLYCADSSFKILKKAGITPHLTGCFERTGLTKRFLHATETSPTTLITSSVVHQNVISSFPDRLIHFLRPHFGMKYFYPNTPTSTIAMHSVAHLGLYSLWLMGCSPIYLVGQDLAFDPKTQAAHVSGHPYPKEEQPWSTITALNNKGEKVVTDVLWVEFAYSLGEIIKRYQIKCFNVIPQDYGIHIPHTQHITPEKSLFNFPQQENLFEKIHQLTRDEHFTERQEVFLSRLYKATDAMQKKFPLLIKAFQEIAHYISQGNLDKTAYIELRKKIEPLVAQDVDFLKPFMLGKNLDISKNMPTLPVTGTETIDQWNYLSFLTTLLGHEISSIQTLQNAFKEIRLY